MPLPVVPPWRHAKPIAYSVHRGAPVLTPHELRYRVRGHDGATLVDWTDAVLLGGTEYVYVASDYDPAMGAAGRRTIDWTFTPTMGDDAIEWSVPWDTYRQISATPVYALVSDLRDEGVAESVASNSRLASLLTLASLEVGRITGRTFGARYETWMLDGRGAPRLLLGEPIIVVDEVVIGAESATDDAVQPIDPGAYRVFNRHITEGLIAPDDRENPKIEMRGYSSLPRLSVLESSHFSEGVQNVRVSGVFGYTEPDGSPYGAIPPLITRATMLLAARLSASIGNPVSGFGDASAWKVVEEQTRDQRVRFADLGSTAAAKSGTSLRGAFTGDPEIDTILSSYVRGPRFGAA